MTRAFAYLRVSGKDQIDGDGFPRQRAAIAVYASQHGYSIAKWFEERAVAGKTEWAQRPAWSEMVLQLGSVNTIFVERLDRLARDLMVQEHIIADLRRRRVSLISVAEPDLCIDDPSRKLLRQIMGAIAEYDRAMITAKLAGARKRQRAATGHCEGRKPFGALPGEAETLQRMRALRNSGLSLAEISDSLNEAGKTTRGGGLWIPATVSKILNREERKA